MASQTAVDTDTQATQAPVLVSVKNTTGVLELNRPRALNSLNLEMIHLITDALKKWRDDPEVSQVLITSTSEKAFCAGGDVRSARDGILAGETDEVDRFFTDEYTMNNVIATYPKPYIAIINGVAMGGGLGVSAHGSHRVVTERSFASMPETAIGFVTDVGLSRVLQTMKGTGHSSTKALGTFLGATAWRLNPTEMLWSGLGTHVVDSGNLEEVIEDIIALGADPALDKHSISPNDDNKLAPLVPDIEAAFAPAEWKDIQEQLAKPEHTELKQVVDKLTAQSSPSSLVATALLFAANADAPDMRSALDKEEALGEVMRSQPDFAEGVRAVLVDKSRDGKFQPTQVSEVDDTPYREALGL